MKSQNSAPNKIVRVYWGKHREEPPQEEPSRALSLRDTVLKWAMTVGVCLMIWACLSPLFYEQFYLVAKRTGDFEAWLFWLACFLSPLLLVSLSSTRKVIVKTRDQYFPPANTNNAALPIKQTLVRASSKPLQEQKVLLLRAATEGQGTPPDQLARAVNGSLPLFLLLLLLGLTPRLAWAAQSPRLLLDHAAKAAKVKDAAVTCWLSDYTLLVVTSDKRTEKREGYYDPSQWKGKAHLLNTRTHRITALPGLTRMLQRWRFEPEECESVCGGKWLLWWAADAPDHYPNTLISPRSGFRHYHRQFTKGDNTYWLNNHIWVDQDRFDNWYESHPCLHIFDVNHPAREKSLRVDAPATRRWIARQTDKTFLYAALLDEEGGWRQPLLIGKYSVADYRLLKHSRPLHTYRIPLPAGLDVQRVEVSPDQRKVLIETTSKQWTTLWTCRVDGSRLHSLGTIRRRDGDYYLRAKWLPGSSKIAFEAEDTLYTVKAD